MPDWPVVFSSLKNVSQTIRNSFPNTSKFISLLLVYILRNLNLLNQIYIALIPVLGNHDVFPGDMYPSEAEAFYRAYLT